MESLFASRLFSSKFSLNLVYLASLTQKIVRIIVGMKYCGYPTYMRHPVQGGENGNTLFSEKTFHFFCGKFDEVLVVSICPYLYMTPCTGWENENTLYSDKITK